MINPIVYKGYEIDRNLLAGKFTVLVSGDEIVYNTMKEAIEAINVLTEEDNDEV